jgi:hypothetical protein
VPPPSTSAVSAADTAGDDADAPGEGDAEADGDGKDDGEDEGDAEADGDGDALGCAEPPEACTRTRWPAAIGAEPVITSVRDPTGGGAEARTGAGCPLAAPRVRRARVADAGT